MAVLLLVQTKCKYNNIGSNMGTKFLEPGEFQYGCYKVQYVEWANDEWNGTGFWLQATVTNRRLLVFPEMGVYPQDYETISPTEIMRVWNVSLAGRDGILIRLSDKRC